jgi:hypothetical protein
MTLRLRSAAMVIVCAAQAPLAQAGSFLTDVAALGYSASNMDRSVDPRQDFHRYAAGNWLKKTEIPATDPDVGGFSLLAHNLNDQLLKIIRGAADAPADKRDRLQQQVGDFYRAAMDTPRLDALGLKPLEADLKAIDQLGDAAAFGKLAAQLQFGFGATPLINAAIGADPKQSTMNVLKLYPGIRALNQDEYAKPEGQPIRDLYLGLHRQDVPDPRRHARAGKRQCPYGARHRDRARGGGTDAGAARQSIGQLPQADACGRAGADSRHRPQGLPRRPWRDTARCRDCH